MSEDYFDENDMSEDAQELFDKLNDPIIKEKLDNLLAKIQDILEVDIQIFAQISDDPNDDVHINEIISNYSEKGTNNGLTLGQFIKHISTEDNAYKVSIDPKYLDDGLNNIKNVLITTLDDNVIIIPKKM